MYLNYNETNQFVDINISDLPDMEHDESSMKHRAFTRALSTDKIVGVRRSQVTKYFREIQPVFVQRKGRYFYECSGNEGVSMRTDL